MDRDAAIGSFLRNRGGVNQRQAASSTRSTDSNFSFQLRQLWAWGYIQAPVVERLALAQLEDNKNNDVQSEPILEKLANLGGHTHARQKLLRIWQVPNTSPLPIGIRVPCMPFKGNQWVPTFVDTKVMMMNEWLEKIYTHFPEHFQKLLGAGLQDFWFKVKRDDPRLVDHPMLREKPMWKTQAIPFIMHGDGMNFTMKGNSLLCQSIVGLLHKGWSEDNTSLLACFPKNCRTYGSIYGEACDTWDVYWKYIAHGLKAMYEGRHPERDPYEIEWPAGSYSASIAGKELCGGNFFGVVWGIASDMEHAANELKYPHWKNNEYCAWCPAKKSNGDSDDYRILTEWKLNSYDTNSQPGRCPTHSIFSSIPGIGRFTFTGDWMHTIDGGVAGYLNFGFMNDLIDADGPFAGQVKLSRIKCLWSDLQEAYDECNIQQGRMQCLTQAMLDSSVCCLGVKCSVNKKLIPAMAVLARRYDDSSLKAGHRIICYEKLNEMCDIYDRSGFFLETEQDEIDMMNCCDEFLFHYKALHAMHPQFDRYLMPGKFHNMWHIAANAKFLSPKVTACYSFEDFIGKVQRCGKSCTAGTQMHKVPTKIFSNVVVAKHDIFDKK